MGYIIATIFIILFIIFIIKYFKLKKIKEEKYITELNQKYNYKINELKQKLSNIQNEINNKTEFNNSLFKIRADELNRIINTKREALEAQLNTEIAEWAKSAQEAATFSWRQSATALENLINESQIELQELNDEIADSKKRRDALNQEILRRRAIEEQQDFYRIQLDEPSKRDISILNEVRPRLSKFDSLDKLIYDIYVKKPVDEMVKRVLEGRAPSGIYKITRLKTGEIYIGKSTDVKARFTQHAKTVFNWGTIAHSILHTTMTKDGIENFAWELIEEVPKDQLGVREKYWIDFYDSKRYGLNEKAGG